VHRKQLFNRANVKEKWGKLTDDDLALKALDAAELDFSRCDGGESRHFWCGLNFGEGHVEK